MPNGEQDFNQKAQAEQAFRDAEAAKYSDANEIRLLLEKLQEVEAEAVRMRALHSQRAEEARTTGNQDAVTRDVEGQANQRGSEKQAAVATEVAVKQVFKKFKEVPGTLPPENTASGRVVRALINKIDEDEVNQQNAPYLFEIIRKSLAGLYDNPLDALATSDFKNLQVVDSVRANKVKDAVKESAAQIGISQEEIQEFEEEVQEEEVRGTNGEADQRQKKEMEEAMRKLHEQEGKSMYGEDEGYKMFYGEPEDQETLAMIKDPKVMLEHVKEIKSAVDRDAKFSGESDRDKAIEVSRRVQERISLFFSKLFRQADEASSQATFQDILQRGNYYTSIHSVHGNLSSRLDLLIAQADRLELDPTEQKLLEGLEFYNLRSGQRFGREVLAESGEDMPIDQYKPILEYEKARTFGDFLRGIKFGAEAEYNTREYLINGRALLLRGATGDQSFWQQMTGYSSQFTATHIDSMQLMPDFDIFMDAYRLYSKYLDEEFAQRDWIHDPTMFSPSVGEVYTDIELRVLKDLRKIYQHDPDIQKNDWRLRRALTIGLGMSQNIYMSELEKAAMADPHVEVGKDGFEATENEYYRAGPQALLPLNPTHWLLRWRRKAFGHWPILYAHVGGPGRFRWWNHAQLWDRMQKFRETFEKGRGHLELGKEDQLFMDRLTNFTRAGGVMTRGSWRLKPAYSGWLQEFDAHGNPTKLSILDQWKSLENIGVDVLREFIQSNLESFLKDKDLGPEHREFLNYLYQKYIPNPDLEDDREKFRPDAEKAIEHYIKEGFIKNTQEDRDWAIETEINRVMLHKALAGMFLRRMPTKLITLERTRTTHDGVRAWKHVQQAMGMDNRDNEFNDLVLNLQLVESRVRGEASRKMREHLRTSSKKTLYDFDPENREYIVTEEKIREYLGEIKLPPTRINQVVELHKQIKHYAQGPVLQEFGDKVRQVDAIGKRDTRNWGFAFSVAHEETDVSFLALRNAGPQMLKRTFGDIADAEVNVSEILDMKFMGALKGAALDGKHDFTPVVESIKQITDAISRIYTGDYKQKVAHDLAGMAINYFRKDSAATNIFTKYFRIGKYNSVAAESTRTLAGVWEWETSEIHEFITELERQQILPKQATDFALLSETTRKEPGKVLFKLFGKEIKLPDKYIVDRKPRSQWTAESLKKEFGGTKWDIAKEVMNKYLPLFIAFLIFTYVSKAIKEATDEKK